MTRPGLVGAAVLLFAAIAFTATASAQSADDTKKAAAHFRQGRAYFDQKLFRKAVDEYKKAYELSKKPALLFNIARALHEAGERDQAIDYYNRYLQADPDGVAVQEAREYIAELERKRLEETEAQKKAAEEAKKKKVEGHLKQAKLFLDAGLADRALVEYRAAYELSNDPEHLFQTAEIERLLGKDEALNSYQAYVDRVPTGGKSDEARGHIATLLAAQQKKDSERITTPPKDDEGTEITTHGGKTKLTDNKWFWIGAGAAALATGLVIDVAPGSSRNGEVNGLDFVPLPFYGAGLLLIGVGVF